MAKHNGKTQSQMFLLRYGRHVGALDHWSLSLVRDVTSTFFANYHAGSEGEK